MKFLYTKAEGEMWQVGESRLDERNFICAIVARQQWDGFHSVLLPNDMRWDQVSQRWEKQPEGQFKEALEYAEGRRAFCAICWLSYSIAEGHQCAASEEALRRESAEAAATLRKTLTACESNLQSLSSVETIFQQITALTKVEQIELYTKMHKAFDHCRIYK